MQKHIDKVHGEKRQKTHKCDSCGQSFFVAAQLKEHVHTVHEGNKDYKCDACGNSFSQEENLKTHIQTIQEYGKVHKCETCGKTLSSTRLFEEAYSHCL